MKKANLEELFSEIRIFCQAHADPARMQKYARYFKEGFDAYGVDQKIQERQRDLWLEKYRAALGLKGFLDLGDKLVQTGKYEEGTFAIWFAMAYKKEFTPETLGLLGRWLDNGLSNWAHTDFICGEVLSYFLTKEIVTYPAFSDWRTAKSRWKRRAVPVTLIKGLKAGLPVSALLKFINPMMRDPERVVHQGLGWFLREAWKKYPESVEAFLLKWKDTCARLIIQYATEKMTAEQKARFKKKKI